jgi:hypothetical protein
LRKIAIALHQYDAVPNAEKNASMNDIDKILVIIALVLGLLDLVNVGGPLSRISGAGLGVVLLAIVALHQGHVLNF